MERSVTRVDFIRRMVVRGFSHSEAAQAFEAFMDTIAEGIRKGNRVALRDVGALVPTTQKSVVRTMSFVNVKGGKRHATHREFFMGRRLRYSFRLFRSFKQRHDLQWKI